MQSLDGDASQNSMPNFHFWHEVARHDALLTARKRQFSEPVAFVYLIARPFLRLDNFPTVSAEAERFFSKQSPLAADAVMGHFGWLRTGFDRLSPNGVVLHRAGSIATESNFILLSYFSRRCVVY